LPDVAVNEVMISSYQWHWGVEQWVAFLKDKEVPVIPRSKQVIQEIEIARDDRLSPKTLAEIVLNDPYLALKLLRRAEDRRSHHLSQETTTALGAVLQAGVDGIVSTVSQSDVCTDSNPGLNDCEARVVIAAKIARKWGSLRTDMSADELAMAALLSETGELILWHFAPEVPQKALDELNSGRAFRTLQAQQKAAGFQFRQLTLALTEAWELPRLITQLIKGSDNPRANITRLAMDTARHITAHPENPAIPADIVNIKGQLPGISHRNLISALPISDEYKETVLQLIAEDKVTMDRP